jgi:hypothetical protein
MVQHKLFILLIKLTTQLYDLILRLFLQELAELAMGTYKHIGRIRSARMIGRDLAAFYRRLGQAQKAAAFLGDSLATFREEGWPLLETQTLLELAECFRDLGDKER